MEVAVIGAGPAGMAAAVQLVKEGVDLVLYEKGDPGGMLRYANRVDNVLGHGGLCGEDLVRTFEHHIETVGIVIEREEVDAVTYVKGGFRLLAANRERACSFVIAATGTGPKTADLPGVLYKIEDPDSFRGRRILIIGGGDLALDNALRLHRYGAHPSILYRGPIKANAGLVKEASGIPTLEDDMENIKRTRDGYELRGETFDAAAAFIGRDPELSLIKEMKYGEIRLPHGKTDIPGLYVVGDAALGPFRQTTLSAGMGIAAAMDIARTVKERWR